VNVAIRRTAVQALTYLTFLLVTLLSNAEAVTPENANTWLLVAAISAIVPVLILDAVWWVNLTTRGGQPLASRESLLFSFMIATAFAVTEVITARALDVEPAREPLLGAVSTILAVTVIGTGLMLLMQARRNEEERRQLLLEEGIALELARQDVGDIVQQMRLALQSDIDDALIGARVGLEERLQDQEQLLAQDHWPAIAEELRATADDTVRSLSRKLWARTAIGNNRLGLSQIIRNIITQQPFRPFAVVLVYLIATTAEVVTTLGWTVGATTLAVGAALILTILGCANRLMRRFPQHHAAIFISAVIIVETAGLLSFPVWDRWAESPYTWGEFAASFILGSLVILASSALGSIRTHRDDIARTFQADIDQELIESIAASRRVAQLARESARMLHGSVQTRLIACAVAIERASDSRDAEGFRAALHEAHTVLNEPTRFRTDDEVTLSEEVERKAALWSGLCLITVKIDSSVALEQGRVARDVGRTVEEGLANAIRHGGAGHIRVDVSPADAGVIVVIDDDGSGPVDVTRGLGSSMLDAISENWSLNASQQGAMLRVELPAVPA